MAPPPSYRNQLHRDLSQGIDMTGGMIGSAILGTEQFVTRVRETFLKGKNEREQPSAALMHRAWSKNAILAVVKKETGRDVEAIKRDKGRPAAPGDVMELLYQYGRLKGPEIGAIFGVGYRTVSQEGKRLRERMTKDNKLERLFSSFERVLLTAKIPLSLKRKKGAGYNSRPCR